MDPGHIFQLVSISVGIGMLLYVYMRGRSILEDFPDLEDSEFVFIEDKASGYSNHSIRARKGGANKVLKIRVTEADLWLYSSTIFAFILKRVNLLHKVPLEDILSVDTEEYTVIIRFYSEGEETEVVLFSRYREELIAALTNPSEDIG